MIGFSLNINDYEYAVSGSDVYCASVEPCAESWQDQFDFMTSEANEEWTPACTYVEGAPADDADADHPDWTSLNIKSDLMFSGSYGSQTTSPTFVWSQCGNPDIDTSIPKTAWCRFRFNTNRGPNSGTRRT